MDMSTPGDATSVMRAKCPPREELVQRFKTVRTFTEYLVEPLEVEDFVVQATDNASPTKWHLAHVSWFFETFVLQKAQHDYTSLHPQYAYLFNSYYLQTGKPHARSKRGLLTRPTVEEVFEYRRYVDKKILDLLESISDEQLRELGPIIEIGIHHEQQHQELILTDLKYLFGQSPLYPVYRGRQLSKPDAVSAMNWISFDEGVYEIGSDSEGFSYDNEHPRHRVFLEPFELADRLVTNADYLRFMNDGGYNRPELWLDEGWATVRQRGWKAPLYWVHKDGKWCYYTLSGLRAVHPDEPLTHVSYFEADAFARWMEARLPTEAEWEVAAGDRPYDGNFVENGCYHPQPVQQNESGIRQLYGDVWEWTSSSYSPYPGYRPLPGALGEYNGKFMSSQYVLRGGSCATSQTHIRNTYRNFFHPDARWQFSGIRLARTNS